MLSVRTPESTLLNTELVAVNRLSIDNLATAVSRKLMLLALSVSTKKLIVFHVRKPHTKNTETAAEAAPAEAAAAPADDAAEKK